MFSHQEMLARVNDVKIVDLPVIPPQVSLKRLDADLFLVCKKSRRRLNKMHLHDGCYYFTNEYGKQLKIFVINGVLHAVNSRLIGRGFMGKVMASQNLETGQWEVCKIPDGQSENNYPNEIKFLGQMDLLPIPGGYKNNKMKYHSKHCQYDKDALFMQYLPGERIETVLNHPLCTDQLLQIFLDLMSKVRALLDKKIWHSDLHDQNILYDFIINQIHIIDFGIAEKLIEKDKDIYDDYMRSLERLQSSINNNWLKNNFLPFLKSTIKQFYHTENTIQLTKECHEKVMAELTRLQSILPADERKYRIGVLDVNDYKNKKVGTDDLKTYSEVWLVDRRNTATLIDYLNCRKHLQLKKIWVGDKVFVHPSSLRLGYHLSLMIKKRHPNAIFSLINVASGKKLHKDTEITPPVSANQETESLTTAATSSAARC